jgi:hypothetical protein
LRDVGVSDKADKMNIEYRTRNTEYRSFKKRSEIWRKGPLSPARVRKGAGCRCTPYFGHFLLELGWVGFLDFVGFALLHIFFKGFRKNEG